MDSCMCCNLQPFLKAIKLVIQIIQWSVPFFIILLGTIDMYKSVLSGDEKAVIENRTNLIKRILYGITIFLVPLLVELTFKLIDNNILKDNSDLASPTNWISCWNSSKSNVCSSCSNSN